MDHIVHLGKGRTIQHGGERPFVDPTVSRPRGPSKRIITRLKALREVMHMRQEARPDRFVPTVLLELRHRQCRYPINDHLFCGALSAQGKSWCGEHDDLVHGRGRVLTE